MRALALVLALAALAAAMPAGEASVRPVEHRAVWALAGSVAPSGVGPLGPPAETVESCGGMSPVTTACSLVFTGSAGSFYLSTDAGTGFTGTVVATVSDAHGRARSLACTYFVFVGPVNAPSCTLSGDAVLVGPDLQLVGSATDAGKPPVGYWEARVTV